MKKYIVTSLLIIITLTACAPVYQTIKPITSEHQITPHSENAAILTLRSGDNTKQSDPVRIAPAPNAAAAVVSLVLAPIMQHKVDQDETASFKLKDELVFMHSLYKYLSLQHTFKHVYWQTHPSHTDNATHIGISFNQTRVGEPYQYTVILDVSMKIKQLHHVSHYHYFISESEPKPDNIKSNLYVYHANKAAQRLMHDLIRDLNTTLIQQQGE